ncbi:MAG: class I SAM-dependent methyltransferase [Fimbriiglobus sp.]
MIPDWQLPAGVDHGLWDYLHSGEMVGGYDAQMAGSPLAAADVRFCEAAFGRPGRLVDLGCGTGRLGVHFAALGFDCVGVDLSTEMLRQAERNAAAAGVTVRFLEANLVDLTGLPDGDFDHAACLFSTLGMVRGADNRAAAVRAAFRVLKPGGRFVIHAHNRFFRGLGWRRTARELWKLTVGSADAGDITMPQGYGGAPLTLHHFHRAEIVRLLESAGFAVERVEAVTEAGGPAGSVRAAYGFLVLARK